jgi:hypothetical protein
MKRVMVIASAVAAMVISIGGQANAAEPWEPFHSAGWTAAAGRYCDFPLQLDIVFDDERTRVVERYPDGAEKKREYIGPLVVEFSNMDTGRRHRYNVSAQGFLETRQDGSWARFSGHGPFGMGFRATDPYPRGYYVLTGNHAVDFAVDGTRSMAVDAGTEHNVCGDL